MTNAERAQRFLMARTMLNRNGRETKRAVSMATGVQSSALVDYENPQSSRVPNGTSVEKLAVHYGVNAAWLFGQSESWSADTDIQSVCDTIGLTPDAVNILRDYMKDPVKKELVNSFICSEEFSRTIILLQAMRRMEHDTTKAVDYTSAFSAALDCDLTLSEQDVSEMMVWRASQEMTNVIRELSLK